MSEQRDNDTVLHQEEHEDIVDEMLDGQDAENATIATPASPGASYVQAEVVALRTAIAAIIVVLKNSNIIPDS